MTLWQSLAARRGADDAPCLIFLAGPNGAGKSTFFDAYLSRLGLPFVNADRIAARFRASHPEQPGEQVDQAAFELAESLRRSFLEAGVSFCTETVFSDPVGAKLEYLQEARRRGVYVFLVFVGLESTEFSIARVMQRVGQGGHDIPDEKLRERFPRTLENLRRAVSLVDEAYLFDNSSADHPYRLIATYAQGQLSDHQPPLPRWAEGLPGL